MFGILSKYAMQTCCLMHQKIVPNLIISGSTEDTVQNIPYLGAVFDSKLSWQKYVEFLSHQVIKRLPILKRSVG